MPTEKLKDKNIRKLTKVAKHSLSVTLPIEICKNWVGRNTRKLSSEGWVKGLLLKTGKNNYGVNLYFSDRGVFGDFCDFDF